METITILLKINYPFAAVEYANKKGAERKQNPVMTQIQLAERLNLTRKQVQKVIKVLQEEGSLEREGSNRNDRWVVRG